MRRARARLLGTVWAVAACGAGAPDRLVQTDGRFDDWSDVPPLIEDDRGDAPEHAAVDLGTVGVLDDPAYLHLRIDLGRPVNAQAMRGMVAIAFDADGQAETGGRAGDLEGADLVVELSRQDAPRPSGVGLGIGYRLVSREGARSIQSGYDLELVVAPTFSSSQFELRITRGSTLASGDSAFTRSHVALQMVYVAGADTVDRTDVGRYALRTAHQPRGRPSAAIPPKLSETFRLLQWNVGETQVRDELEAFARVIGAANPDVVVLDEVFRGVQRGDIERLLEHAVDDAGSWDVVMARSGGRQRTVVASRLPLRPEPYFTEVTYPVGVLDSLLGVFGDTSLAQLIRIERAAGLSTVAAWVTVGLQNVLVVALDLQSAGYDGSPRDRLREVQARSIHDRLSAALARGTPGNGTFPVVISGDFNLVGSRRPLAILSQSLPETGPLAPAEPYRLGDRTQTTWRDPRDVFTPGRLDYLLVTPQTLDVRQSFVFDTAALSDSTLNSLGVRRDDALVTSHHLPIVADIALVR